MPTHPKIRRWMMDDEGIFKIESLFTFNKNFTLGLKTCLPIFWGFKSFQNMFLRLFFLLLLTTSFAVKVKRPNLETPASM